MAWLTGKLFASQNSFKVEFKPYNSNFGDFKGPQSDFLYIFKTCIPLKTGFKMHIMQSYQN